MKIIINGSEVHVGPAKLSYADVVQLGGEPHGPTYTMTYHAKLEGDLSRDGSLAPGEKVEPCEGMIFSFIVTGNA